MLELAAHEHAVALVDERLGVVPVVPHREVGVLDGVGKVRLVEVDEGEVGGGVGDQLLLLVLVALERLDGLLGVRVLELVLVSAVGFGSGFGFGFGLVLGLAPPPCA